MLNLRETRTNAAKWLKIYSSGPCTVSTDRGNCSCPCEPLQSSRPPGILYLSHSPSLYVNFGIPDSRITVMIHLNVCLVGFMEINTTNGNLPYEWHGCHPSLQSPTTG